MRGREVWKMQETVRHYIYKKVSVGLFDNSLFSSRVKINALEDLRCNQNCVYRSKKTIWRIILGCMWRFGFRARQYADLKVLLYNRKIVGWGTKKGLVKWRNEKSGKRRERNMLLAEEYLKCTWGMISVSKVNWSRVTCLRHMTITLLR